MKKQYNLTANNFSSYIKGWSYEKFIDTFKDVYPVDELNRVAVDIGIKVSKVNSRLLQNNNEEKEGGSVTN